MANIYDPNSWAEYPEEIKVKLYAIREIFINTVEAENTNLEPEEIK